MTPLLFDLIVIGLVVLSLAVGFARGFCNEVFTVFGWMAAIIATIYFINPVTAFLLDNEYVEKEWVARLGGAAGIFLVTMGLCSLITYFLTKTLHSSRLGIIDRLMGFAFGALRAIVLLGLAFLLFTHIYSDEDKRPKFIQDSQTLPVLESSAAMVQTIIPIGDVLNGDEDEEETKADKDALSKELGIEEEKPDSALKTEKLLNDARRMVTKPIGLEGTDDTSDE